jgi:hypothetical protein
VKIDYAGKKYRYIHVTEARRFPPYKRTKEKSEGDIIVHQQILIDFRSHIFDTHLLAVFLPVRITSAVSHHLKSTCFIDPLYQKMHLSKVPSKPDNNNVRIRYGFNYNFLVTIREHYFDKLETIVLSAL